MTLPHGTHPRGWTLPQSQGHAGTPSLGRCGVPEAGRGGDAPRGVSQGMTHLLMVTSVRVNVSRSGS